MSATIPVLDSKSVSAYFDLENDVLFVSYYGVLDASTSGNLTTWLDQMAEVIGTRPIRGMVFDLRKVVRFKRENLFTTAEQTEQLQEQLDHQKFPVALVVANYYQEQMAKITLLVTPDANRRQIVYSMESALTYIESWYAAH
jgi:hypothetical protein